MMGKEGKRKGKEGKRKTIFSKSLFLKTTPNNELHKIPVLSPDLLTWQSSQESTADPQPGEYAPQPLEYYLSSKSNIHFVVSWNPTTAAFLHVGKNNPVNPVDLVYSGGYENIYRANPALPSPLRGQSQSHSSKTTSNSTSKESNNYRIFRVFQIL